MFSPAAADLAVPGRLQAEGRPLHRPQRSGQQHLSHQSGHQWKCHGRHGRQDAGQSPADQHQTQVCNLSLGRYWSITDILSYI